MDPRSFFEGVTALVEFAGLTTPILGSALTVLSKLSSTYANFEGSSSKCAHLNRRLKEFILELDKIVPATPEAEELLSCLLSLIKDFQNTVDKYAEWSPSNLWFSYVGKLDETIDNFNAELNSIIAKTIAISTFQNSKKLEEIYKLLNTVPQDIISEKAIKMRFRGMPNKDITFFVTKLKHIYRSLADPELTSNPINEMIKRVIEIAENDFLDKEVVETPPTWMVIEDEVIFGEQIDSRGATCIYIGEWNGAPVAIKKYSAPDNEIPVFDKHLRIWRTLLHPNVVQLYGAGTDRRRVPFFVYEYASRQSLDKCWESLSPKETWKMLYQAALGLTYLHKKHVVHGNLSCSKLLVTEKGDVKLFGFSASYISRNNKSNSEKPKINRDFAAPECLGLNRGVVEHSPRFASDVYSLGLMIMEAIGKQNPFKGHHEDGEMEERKQNNDLDLLQPQCMNEDAWMLVKQMCVFDPIQRVPLSYVTEQLKRYAQSAI